VTADLRKGSSCHERNLLEASQIQGRFYLSGTREIRLVVLVVMSARPHAWPTQCLSVHIRFARRGDSDYSQLTRFCAASVSPLSRRADALFVGCLRRGPMETDINLVDTGEGDTSLYHVETITDWQGREVEVPVYDIPVDARMAMAVARLTIDRPFRLTGEMNAGSAFSLAA
jgi:hypothetical protein